MLMLKEFRERCIVHWIPPIAIHGGGGEEVVHRVK